jgi:hypothetical protein
LGQSSREHATNAGGDNLRGVGTAWQKDVVDPGVGATKSVIEHVGNLINPKDKPGPASERTDKLEIDIKPKK